MVFFRRFSRFRRYGRRRRFYRKRRAPAGYFRVRGMRGLFPGPPITGGKKAVHHDMRLLRLTHDRVGLIAYKARLYEAARNARLAGTIPDVVARIIQRAKGEHKGGQSIGSSQKTSSTSSAAHSVASSIASKADARASSFISHQTGGLITPGEAHQGLSAITHMMDTSHH